MKIKPKQKVLNYYQQHRHQHGREAPLTATLVAIKCKIPKRRADQILRDLNYEGIIKNTMITPVYDINGEARKTRIFW